MSKNNPASIGVMTKDDAARIQSGADKAGQGGSGTFAARAQAAADRNENTGATGGGAQQGGAQGQNQGYGTVKR